MQYTITTRSEKYNILWKGSIQPH